MREDFGTIMTTWNELMLWNPAPLENAAADAKANASRIRSIADTLSNAKLDGDSWSGQSADAAGEKLTRVVSALESLADEFDGISRSLDEDAAIVGQVVSSVDTAFAVATTHGFMIAADGSVLEVGLHSSEVGASSSTSGFIDECAHWVRDAFEKATDLVNSNTSLIRGQALRSFLTEFGKTLLQDQIAEKIARSIAHVIESVTPSYAGAGALADGGIRIISIPDPGYVKAAGTVLKRGAPVIGAVIDLHGQLESVREGRQDVGDAVIKTAARAGIGIASSAAAGAVIGSVVPGLGTAIGAVAGVVVGTFLSVGGSVLFDAAYDSVGGWKGVGDAVMGWFR